MKGSRLSSVTTRMYCALAANTYNLEVNPSSDRNIAIVVQSSSLSGLGGSVC